MLADYITAAMNRAHYELLPEGEGAYAEIPELPGVWANGDTVGEAREDLRLALEGWVALALARNVPVPNLNGVRIAPTLVS